MSEEVNKEQTKGAEQVERDELSEDQLQEAAGGSTLVPPLEETGDSTQRNAGAASPPNTAPGADTSDERIDEAADFPSRN